MQDCKVIRSLGCHDLFLSLPCFFPLFKAESKFSAAAKYSGQLATQHRLYKGQYLLSFTSCCGLSVPLMPSSAQCTCSNTNSNPSWLVLSRDAYFSRWHIILVEDGHEALVVCTASSKQNEKKKKSYFFVSWASGEKKTKKKRHPTAVF